MEAVFFAFRLIVIAAWCFKHRGDFQRGFARAWAVSERLLRRKRRPGRELVLRSKAWS
jgi:hypothetical protein